MEAKNFEEFLTEEEMREFHENMEESLRPQME